GMGLISGTPMAMTKSAAEKRARDRRWALAPRTNAMPLRIVQRGRRFCAGVVLSFSSTLLPWRSPIRTYCLARKPSSAGGASPPTFQLHWSHHVRRPSCTGISALQPGQVVWPAISGSLPLVHLPIRRLEDRPGHRGFPTRLLPHPRPHHYPPPPPPP